MPSEGQPGRHKRVQVGGSGGAWAGYVVAMLLALRAIGPMMRGLGPAGRQVVLMLAGVALIVVLAGQLWRQHREDREIEAARARREQARAHRSRTRGGTPSAATPRNRDSAPQPPVPTAGTDPQNDRAG
jgi:threonine/homoserine/homoserine lactone efflux protein